MPGIDSAEQRFDTEYTCYEMRLKHGPWVSGDYDTATLHARRMPLQFMSTMSSLNWQVCASVDVSAKYYKGKRSSYPIDVNSWILCSDNSCSIGQEELPPSYYPHFVGVQYFSENRYTSPPPSYDDVM